MASSAASRIGPERVVYRDQDEFNKALDTASESIRKAKGPDVVGNVAWWGLLAVIAVLVLADWVFDWDIRRTLVPGVDLVKPAGLLVAAMLIYHHAWTRNRHGRILRDRLCFGCGTSLVGVTVDDQGDGCCPTCDRLFNLGGYRRPNDNRGRDFHGYLDEAHFDKAIYAAAEQVRRTRGFGFEYDVMGWLWIALGVSFFASLILDLDLFDWIPVDLPYHGIWFGLLGLWGAWYSYRVGRLKPSIVDRRGCMNCGFCLLGTEVDDDEIGRCPECGTTFALGQYVKPPPPAENAEEPARP